MRVAKKHKQHLRVLSRGELKSRIERAAREDRYQQALELAKQLYKDDPSPESRALLQSVYLGRARQLRQRGYLRDARTVLENAVNLADGGPAWVEQLAEELAAAGDVRRALQFLQRIPGSAAQPRILTLAADTALGQGQAGRDLLPAELQGQFDLIVRAFGQMELAQDDAARETLQGIGLQSPFLEWKLLLRGLLAYYQNDDLRAIENWQRLNPERLPARLAAPLRFRIDSAYRVAQQPDAQNVLRKQADQLQAPPLIQPLRDIQAALSREQLPQAFRLAEGVLPLLRREAPQLVPRLASCYYWTIIHGGKPEDINRYRRVFGVPPDDPDFARLQALVMEQIPDMQQAQDFWKEFEQSVANNPAAWPGDQGRRVRALVWCHMGQNAAAVPDPDKIPDLPPFLRDHPDRPRPLKPSAEQCFEQSLKLAPDQLDPYEALFHFHQQEEHHAKAIQAGEQLLEHFPEHLTTLKELGELYMGAQEYAKALAVLQRALKINPLDRRLRGGVSAAHLFNARTFAEAGRFDEARAEYQAALSYAEHHRDSSALCKWAACEFKAGDTARAEELLQQAVEQGGTRLAVAFNMLIEAIRLKLPKVKSRFDKEFKAALGEPPSASAAVDIAATASAHKLAGIKYHGQKTHEKKVQAYLERAIRSDWSEEQLERVCGSLLGLKTLKQLREYTALGRQRFPQDPYFPYLEAESYLAQGPSRCPAYRVQPLLETARHLVQALPRDHRHKELQELIEERSQMMAFNPFARGPGATMFESMFEQMFGQDEDEDDFDEDEFW
jgi:tetratricopeptide (TPR) repeat protein